MGKRLLNQRRKQSFPAAATYIDVAILETAGLAKHFGDVVVVDERRKYERDTLPIQEGRQEP